METIHNEMSCNTSVLAFSFFRNPGIIDKKLISETSICLISSTINLRTILYYMWLI